MVRLLDGDPSLFSGFAEEALALHKAGIPFEVVPGVSAASAVPMYAGVPLTTQQATAVHVVDAGDRRHDWAPAVPDHVTAVVLGAPETLAPALVGLLGAGRAPETPVLLTERGTTTQQVSRVTTLGEAERGPGRVHRALPLAGRGRSQRLDALGAVVVRDQAAVRLDRAAAPHQGPGRRDQ